MGQRKGGRGTGRQGGRESGVYNGFGDDKSTDEKETRFAANLKASTTPATAYSPASTVVSSAAFVVALFLASG